MKNKKLILIAALLAMLQLHSSAQTNAPAAAEPHVNAAIVPVSRTGSITNRQNQVLQRAKDASGEYDIEFIGDSITQGWESAGKNVWNEVSAKYKVINFGVSGDRTEHVLWRFGQGQLDGVKAKAAVVMIGTNNSNKNKDGIWAYSDSEILEGVTAIVNEIRRRQPATKVLLLGIFPRGKAFNEQRGRLLEINQALARLDDGKNIFFLDFGSQFIENDGSISLEMMRDALHPGEKGYRIWASAMQPKLDELLK
jgi:lysophospholipase L1-like esterase